MTIDVRDHRINVERSREYMAAQALERGRDSKATHRYLSLRVFWEREGKVISAILCRMHRDARHRQFPNMWDSYEWFPADRRELTVLPRNAKAEKFSMEFQNGRLVLVQPTAEKEKPTLGRPDTAMQVATRFLERELQAGPRDSKELLRLADEQEGITKGTFYGAARKMKIIKHTKDSMWELAPMHAMMEVHA